MSMLSQVRHRPPSRNGDGQSHEADGIAYKMLVLLCVGYAMHAIYAIVTLRSLYGDAAWFLIRIASEGRVTNFYFDFAREFYYSRFMAFGLTQWLAVAAANLGVNSINALAILLGIGFYTHKLVSLLLCYALLPAGKKAFVVFPALAVFAGSINSEMYIVTETHLAISVFWPLFIAATSSKDIGFWKFSACAAALFVNCFTYESIAILGVPLFIVMMVNASGAPPSQRKYWLMLGVISALAIALNWWAILVPRDPVNKASFVAAGLKLLQDTMSGIAYIHVSVLASVLAIVIVSILMLRQGSLGVVDRTVVVLAAAILTLGPLLHFLRYSKSTDLSNSIGDRSVGGFMLQIVVIAMYLCAKKFFSQQLYTRIASVALTVSALAIGQIAWQVAATNSWSNATSVAVNSLRSSVGIAPCNENTLRGGAWYQIPPASVLCHWWVMPLSIVLAPDRNVVAMLTSTESFKPFDPLDASALPGMRFAPVDYSRYNSAVDAQKTIQLNQSVSFSAGSNGNLLIRSGFSVPEKWATWTDGRSAKLGFCLKEPLDETGLQVRFTLNPFVSVIRPSLDVFVKANGHAETTWHFSQENPPISRAVQIPQDHFSSGGCVDLQFEFSDARPASRMGAAGDPRELGIALIDMLVSRP